VDFVATRMRSGRKDEVEESAAFYERLRDLHKKAGRSRLGPMWRSFASRAGVQERPVAAPAERVIRQLEAVSLTSRRS